MDPREDTQFDPEFSRKVREELARLEEERLRRQRDRERRLLWGTLACLLVGGGILTWNRLSRPALTREDLERLKDAWRGTFEQGDVPRARALLAEIGTGPTAERWNRLLDQYEQFRGERDARKWQSALDLLEQAKPLVEIDLRLRRRIEALQNETQLEALAAAALEQARQLRASGQGGAALEALAAIPAGSLYAAEAREVADAALAEERQGLEERVRELALDRKWDAIDRELARFARWGADPGLAPLRTRIEEARLESAALASASALIPDLRTADAGAELAKVSDGGWFAGEKEKLGNDLRNSEEAAPVYREALVLYEQGKADAALERLRSWNGEEPAALPTLGERIAAVHASYEEGLSRQDRGILTEAAGAFQRVLELEKDGANWYARRAWEGLQALRKAAGPIVEGWVEQGIQAFKAGDLAGSQHTFRQTRAVFPDHPVARAYLQQIDEKAVQLYEEGYILFPIDPVQARERWELVRKLLPSDHPTRRKVDERLR